MLNSIREKEGDDVATAAVVTVVVVVVWNPLSTTATTASTATIRSTTNASADANSIMSTTATVWAELDMPPPPTTNAITTTTTTDYRIEMSNIVGVFDNTLSMNITTA